MKTPNIKWAYLPLLFLLTLLGCSKESADPTSVDSGTGGSLARFTIVDNYLYSVDDQNLKTMDLSDPANPQLVSDIEVGFGIETIFPYGNHLFIGSVSEMFIYDITNPASPDLSAGSSFQHATACDPVVAQDTLAFVTLRSFTTGNRCGLNGWEVNDELLIVDIADIQSPELIKAYDMHNPHGLGVDGRLLFLCDGSEGLKVFNISDPNNIQLIHHEEGFTAYDVIPLDGLLLMVSKEGLYQYEYDYPQFDKDFSFEIEELSVIEVE